MESQPLTTTEKSCQEVSDMVAPAPENDNNNLKPVKQNIKFYENNYMPHGDSGNKTSLPQPEIKSTVGKTKTLEETIENLRQSKLLFSNTENVQKTPTNHQLGNHIKENLQNTSYSQITHDIICNCDGAVYLTPNAFSGKLLNPEGMLNEPGDPPSFPCPVLPRTVTYCQEDDSTKVWCYSVAPVNRENTEQSFSHRLAVCLPCRFQFGDVGQLIQHGISVHSLSSLLRYYAMQPEANTSAIIVKVMDNAPMLQLIKFEERISIESLLSRVEAERSESGITKKNSSVTVPTGLTAPVPVSNSQRSSSVSGFCDEHPDGGIECPKCDIILSSTRSLGGRGCARVIKIPLKGK